jgi:hypothetical protein
MPRLVTPSANVYAHGSHTLTPYNRRQRSPTSLSSSDKENASPPQPSPKVFASQAALREKLADKSNTQYYDPHQPREVVKAITAKYRDLIRETNGTSNIE